MKIKGNWGREEKKKKKKRLVICRVKEGKIYIKKFNIVLMSVSGQIITHIAN